MHHFNSMSKLCAPPNAADPDQAALGFDLLGEAVQGHGDPQLQAFFHEALKKEDTRRFLESIFGNSAFLTQCLVNDLPHARLLIAEGPQSAYDETLKSVKELRSQPLAEAALAQFLRKAKKQIALSIATADITKTWSLDAVTLALSDFAEATLGSVVSHLLRGMAESGHISLADDVDPEKNSGLVVIGMGKLGAKELNYSSDIDLMVFYDQDIIKTNDPENAQNHFVRLTRNLVKLMEERTTDGYVFRTDLRIRPDPGSTPLAMSTLAGETYYETLGQNWERAAMIKARPVAGDRQAGAAFLQRLHPFVWRKHLDFAAIQDIHSIKRQINAQRGGNVTALGGHNVKLGRGGIREIEFFAQTQQLIWGGRIAKLRCERTEDTLEALEAHGQIEKGSAADMISDYRYLRTLEHRLQMVDDEQTHSLPKDEKALQRIAVFLGYESKAAFAEDILFRLHRVESTYGQLFKGAESLADNDSGGNLVFTGADADPETISALQKLGYRSPETIDTTIRGWHHGRYRATRSARSRSILTEIMPTLLASLARTADPDTAVLNFDGFLSQLPMGVQLFSLFHANPQLLDLVVQVIGQAPRLAEHLGRNPSVLDNVLAADFFAIPPSLAVLEMELNHALDEADAMEMVLDTSRRWANDRKFQIGVQYLQGHLDANAFAHALSDVAEVSLRGLHRRIEADFAASHGTISGASMAVIAMGKLGSREMTPCSDLDLIFIYEAGDADEVSDGPKGLSPNQYFARLSQRLINAITARTAEGILYEVDMRLRPSGNAGPIASTLASFTQYQERDAWTWEQMALTRARMVSGPEQLCQKISRNLERILSLPRDGDALLVDVFDMRCRIDKEHHTDIIWETKHLRGGLVDVEFIAQYLQLRNAGDHPNILSTDTRAALTKLCQDGLLADDVGDELIEALDLWQAMQSMLRLTMEGYFDQRREKEIPEGLQRVLTALGGEKSFDDLKEKIARIAKRTHAHFIDLIEFPASVLQKRRGTHSKPPAQEPPP
jgi:[glutamine synthetase] adenylyltransferase / [glutamine synthetase]-adenylyl-L-tyrosine phosphorylase